MSHSFYPVTREPMHPRASGESTLTKLLAVLLLLVAGALVYTVVQQRRMAPRYVSFEPKPVAQRPDDKLGADEQATIDIFKRFHHSVVHVTSLTKQMNAFTMNVAEVPQGLGSGFVWDQDGHIVTNFHVIGEGNAASVTLDDGTTYPAKLVGAAPDKDLAVLKIDAPPQKLVPLPIGTSSNLQVGQKVLAIGNPFGLDQTLTTGVISGLGREIEGIVRPLHDMIQTDASINPGNSGGPLLDSSGRLIGINTAIKSPSGGSAGIGFAVPVDTINQIVPQLLKYGKVIRPTMGLAIVRDEVAAEHHIDGVIVYSVTDGGPAAKAGIVGLRASDNGILLGDIIVAADGQAVHRSADLYNVLDNHKVGDEIEVTLVNGGAKRTVKLTLEPSS